MRYRKSTYSGIFTLFVLCLILAGMIAHAESQEVKVIFLDIGQGDAILIEQGSNKILIDGGPSGQALLEKLGKYIPFWDREIEMVIATHPDQDHIEGLVSAMKNYKVDSLIETSAQSDSQLYKNYEELIQTKNIQKIAGQAGVKIKLADAELDILHPQDAPDEVVKDTNMYSIVSKLIFGQNSFLFTGDLPSEEEAKLIQNNTNLSAKVLKAGHHGSKYSSSNEFLEAVKPQDAIISVGKNNRYGHPAPETIDRIKNNKINIFRTDEMGDIEYDCASPIENCAIIAN